MGTSGSYGGSGSSSWQDARHRLEELVTPAGDGANQAAPTDAEPAAQPDGDATTDTGAADVASAIVAALMRDDRELRLRTPRIYPTASYLPGRGGGGGGGGGAGGGGTGSGRTGDSSPRRVGRNIQRGASAIAAAYALREGDREALQALNLDLDELSRLTPWKQCDRILAAVLGDGNHPDETVLRRAAAEQLKQILAGDTIPTALEAIQDFIARLVYEQGLVELRAQRKAGLDLTAVTALENSIKSFIKARVRQARGGLGAAAAVSTAQIQAVAARIGNEAVRIIRAGVPAR